MVYNHDSYNHAYIRLHMVIMVMKLVIDNIPLQIQRLDRWVESS